MELPQNDNVNIYEAAQQYIILIGNPGVGKSTILNGLIGTAKFKSGLSFGEGLTKKLQLYRHSNGIIYGDTPGLSDIKAKEEAAQEITKAITQNGIYKIIFVVTIEAGRVRPDDVATINLVLNSIKHKVHYAVIVNKVSYALATRLDENEEESKAVFGGFNSGNNKTEHFYYFLRDPNLEDIDDQVPKLPQDLIQFIYESIPSNVILKKNVSIIKLDPFEEMKNEFTRQIEELKKNATAREEFFKKTIAQLEKDREEIRKQQQEQFKFFEEEHKKLQNRIENERKQHQQLMEQKQKEFEEKILKAQLDQKQQLQQQQKQFQEQMKKSRRNKKSRRIKFKTTNTSITK